MKTKANNIAPKANLWPLIPEGNYEALCIKAKKVIDRGFGGRTVLYLHFLILNNGFPAETRLFMSFNLSERPGIKSKYLKEWSKAARRFPRRNEEMPVSIFLNKIFQVSVVTVKKDHRNHFKPEELWYSKIESIIT